MDYIDFQIKENKIICTTCYNNKKIYLPVEEAKIIFRILVKYNYDYQELLINDVKTLRYYGVSKKLLEQIKKNKGKAKKKVNRINKYAGMSLAVSGSLILLLTLNSLGLYKNDKEIMPIEEQENVTNVTIVTEYKTTPNIEEEETIIVPDSIFDFSYENRSSSDKAVLTKSLYTDIITKYSNKYGLPSNLMIAVGTQERGTHSTEVSPGGGFGLFQIQVEGGWNWLGKTVTAYNFETEQMETIVVCQADDGTINVNMLADLDYNIKVACMIMASDLVYCDYDIIAALQTYNSGTSVQDLQKKYGDDWVNHRENLAGDTEYVEHVLSYLSEDDNLLQYKDKDGKEYTVAINNVYNNSFSKTR